MTQALKKIVFSIILTTAPLQLLFCGLSNDGEVNQECKKSVDLARQVFSNYKKNPEDIKNRLEKANSDCISHIIDSCNNSQIFELTKFKLKNKQLLSKLGYILLNLATKIKDIPSQDLNLSNEEFVELKNILEIFDKKIPAELRTIVETGETPATAKNEKIKAIMQKLNLALDHISSHNLGLSNGTLNPMNEKLKHAISSLLSEAELKELHTFVTKEKGAFDKIVEELDAIWEIVVKSLS